MSLSDLIGHLEKQASGCLSKKLKVKKAVMVKKALEKVAYPIPAQKFLEYNIDYDPDELSLEKAKFPHKPNSWFNPTTSFYNKGSDTPADVDYYSDHPVDGVYGPAATATAGGILGGVGGASVGMLIGKSKPALGALLGGVLGAGAGTAAGYFPRKKQFDNPEFRKGVETTLNQAAISGARHRALGKQPGWRKAELAAGNFRDWNDERRHQELMYVMRPR
jgi:hypothetical protein